MKYAIGSVKISALALVLAACTQPAETQHAQIAPPPSAPIAETVASPPEPAQTAAELIPVMQAHMAQEAKHRPRGTPTVESVLAALKTGGVEVFPGQQSLAVLTQADYCWHSKTTDEKVAFSICEYNSDLAIERSKEISLTKFASMGERTFLVQGHTMLTLKVHKPGGEAIIEKVKTILPTLQ